MDNLEDDGLRDLFSKLRGYESKKSGITWESVNRNLGSGGFSKAVMLSLAVLIVAIPSYFTIDVNSDREIDNDLQPSKMRTDAEVNSPLAQKPKIVSTQSTERKINSIKESETESRIVVDQSKNEKISQLIQANQLSDSNFEELIISPKEAVKNEEIQIAKEFVDTVSLELLSEEEVISTEDEIVSIKRPISMAVAAFYSFGVVEPLSADDVVLVDYHSKAGYGVKLNMMIPIVSNSAYNLDVGPAYQFMRKGFDFNTNDFGSEKIEHTTLKNTLTSHFVGVGAQFGISRRQLRFGSTIMKSVKETNSMDHFTGSSMLFLDAIKEIKLKHENRFLQLGVSSGIPISGPYTTFKYFPIQLSVGIRNAFEKD
ncbi:MAG: hypothetical protein RH948_17380 [Cyclobacteriaceae bacterium]